MNHPNHEEWMAYLYAELDAKERTRLREHLNDCPQCRTDVTMWRAVMGELDKWQLPQAKKALSGAQWNVGRALRWAAAAVVLIFAGYAVGRVTVAAPPDMEQIQLALETTLEPAIRQNVVDELNRDWAVALAGSYVRLKDELSEEFRRELNTYALHTLAASNTVTNELLTGLIDAINDAQAQDRQWVASAIEQIEYNRLQDRTQLINGLQTLAAETEDELLRTKQDVAQWLAYTEPGGSVPTQLKNPNE